MSFKQNTSLQGQRLTLLSEDLRMYIFKKIQRTFNQLTMTHTFKRWITVDTETMHELLYYGYLLLKNVRSALDNDMHL